MSIIKKRMTTGFFLPCAREAIVVMEFTESAVWQPVSLSFSFRRSHLIQIDLFILASSLYLLWSTYLPFFPLSPSQTPNFPESQTSKKSSLAHPTQVRSKPACGDASVTVYSAISRSSEHCRRFRDSGQQSMFSKSKKLNIV